MTESPMTSPLADPEDRVCFIRSTVDDDGKAACLLKWGKIQALLTPETVLATARELMAAAANAETDIALIGTLRHAVGLSDREIAGSLAEVRERRPLARTSGALRIAAVAGAKTGKPFVTIGRGSMKGQMSPDEARGMAQHWTETAVAAQIDARMRYALGEWDRLNVVEIDELFALVQRVQR